MRTKNSTFAAGDFVPEEVHHQNPDNPTDPNVSPAPTHKKVVIDDTTFFPLSLGRDFLANLIVEYEFHHKTIQCTEKLMKMFGEDFGPVSIEEEAA